MESTNLVVTNEMLTKDITSASLIVDYVVLNALGRIGDLSGPKFDSSIETEDTNIEKVKSKLQTFFRVCGIYLNNLGLVQDYEISSDKKSVSCKMNTNNKIDKQLYFMITINKYKFSMTADIDGDSYPIEESVKYVMNCLLHTAGQIDINHIIYLYFAYVSECIDFDKIYQEYPDVEGDCWLTEESSFLALADKYSEILLGAGDTVMNWTSGNLPRFVPMMNSCLDAIRPYYKNMQYVSENGEYIHLRPHRGRNSYINTIYTQYPMLDGLHVCDVWLGYYHLNDLYDAVEIKAGIYEVSFARAVIDCIMFKDINKDIAWLMEFMQDKVIGNEELMLPEIRRVAVHYGVPWYEVLYWLEEAKSFE